MKMCKRIKFKKEDKKQIKLGTKVLVAAYRNMATEKYKIDAIEKAFRGLKAEEKQCLPDTNNFVAYLNYLMSCKQRPMDTSRGWKIVVRDAYDEIKGSDQIDGQISVDDVNVPNQCDQERVAMEMGATDEEGSVIDELPFDELDNEPIAEPVLLSEDFDIWQSDAYTFMTTYCHYNPDGEGTVTMSLEAFEKLFKSQYGRRNIA